MSKVDGESKRPRILICRLSHIGDCILTLPMLSALRQAMPDAWIAWAVEKPTPQLLEHHPDLDELITIPKGWLKKTKTILAVRKQLREYAFDIAIDPQSIAKSALLGWASGAKTRVGFRGDHGRELSSWFNNVSVEPKSTHLVDRSLELLQGLGINHQQAQFHLPLRESAHCYIDQFLDEQGLSESRYLVINPGASWPSKRWEDERFGKVARELHQQTGLRPVITWAGDEERKMSMAICASSQGAAILAPPTDLQQLAALMQRAELFLGCDTGPLHLAAAVDTICVGLYGPTRPQDSGAYGQKHFAIQNEYQSGNSRQRRRGSNHAMRTITEPPVSHACCRALAAARVAATRQTIERAA